MCIPGGEAGSCASDSWSGRLVVSIKEMRDASRWEGKHLGTIWSVLAFQKQDWQRKLLTLANHSSALPAPDIKLISSGVEREVCAECPCTRAP